MRRLILLLFLVFPFGKTIADPSEISSFLKDEMRSDSLFNSSKWGEFISFADSICKFGIPYPSIYYRQGIANFCLGNYSEALNSFDNLSEMNSDYKEAQYYTYLCNLFLKRNEISNSIGFPGREDSLKRNSFQPVSFVEAEHSYKFSSSFLRHPAYYSRIGISSDIASWLTLRQSFVVFNQEIVLPFSINTSPYYEDKPIPINLIEYHGIMNFSIPSGWTLSTAYHHLSLKFDTTKNKSNLYYFSLKKYFNYWDAGIDYAFGVLNNDNIYQYAVEGRIFPLGNLNLYYGIRLSNLKQKSANYFNHAHTLGFKVFKNFWFESSAIFGKIHNYIENENLYVYNSLDASDYKVTSTLIYSFTPNFVFQAGYSYEPKQIEYLKINYLQHSLNGEIKWTL